MLMRWLLVSFHIDLRLKLMARGLNYVSRGLALSVPPQALGRVEVLEIELIMNGQWFDQPCLCNDASAEKDGVQSVWVGEHMEVLGEGASRELPTAPHIPCLCISSIWMFTCILYHVLYFYFLFFLSFFFAISWAAPAAYGGSQARGLIWAVATSLRQSHSNTRSKPNLQPYTTAHGNARYLTHWARPGIESATSWFLVGFVSSAPWRKLQKRLFKIRICELYSE